jgi:SNF2 family DNA or RNA helicase
VTGLYHPAWHVPFQLDLMARAYLLRQAMVVADMGLGKTHIAMGVAAACLAFGDEDTVLVVCEKGKLLDWRDELAVHCSMGPVIVYHGADRGKRLQRGPQVVITTYETARQDLAVFVKKGSRKAADGPLLSWLLGRRPVIVYDEGSAKLGNRSSALYKAHAHALRELRRLNPLLAVCVLTGTPIERDWENAYNTLRLMAPSSMPLVKDFDATYTYGRDDYGRLRFRKDKMPEFAEICRPRLLRKRKTDPDVIGQFPVKVERFERIEMGGTLQAKLYAAVEDLAWDADGHRREVPGLSVALRQLAGHPQAILKSAQHGSSRLAKLLAEQMRPRLLAAPSAKTEMLTEYARQLMAEDAKLLAFTFFGQSVLPVLAEVLDKEGFPLFVTHGGMTIGEQHEQRTRFRTCDGGAVLLSSDAGARGLNIPEASCVIEYEPGLTSATRQQRFDRAHRIGHGGVPLTCVTFVLEGTAETHLLRQALARNEQQDILLGDDSDEAYADGYVTAGDRRMLYSMARKRRFALRRFFDIVTARE